MRSDPAPDPTGLYDRLTGGPLSIDHHARNPEQVGVFVRNAGIRRHRAFVPGPARILHLARSKVSVGVRKSVDREPKRFFQLFLAAGDFLPALLVGAIWKDRMEHRVGLKIDTVSHFRDFGRGKGLHSGVLLHRSVSKLIESGEALAIRQELERRLLVDAHLRLPDARAVEQRLVELPRPATDDNQ